MDVTTTSAPWWYVAALAGGFTILGGLITQAGGLLSDRRKAKHDLAQFERAEALRRESEVRAAAASFLVETREVFESFRSNFIVNPDGQIESIKGRKVSLLRTDQAYWTLIFLCQPDVERAARDLLDAVKKFNKYSRDSRLEPFSPSGWERARGLYFKSRKELVRAIKGEPTLDE